MLTLALLQAAAQALSGEHAPAESISASPAGMAAAQLPVPESPVPTVPTGPPSSLLRTKLNRPRPGSDVIFRARFIERLNAGLSGKVTLLSAPAGFGKTTLLTAWVETTCEKLGNSLYAQAMDYAQTGAKIE